MINEYFFPSKFHYAKVFLLATRTNQKLCFLKTFQPIDLPQYPKSVNANKVPCFLSRVMLFKYQILDTACDTVCIYLNFLHLIFFLYTHLKNTSQNKGGTVCCPNCDYQKSLLLCYIQYMNIKVRHKEKVLT